MVNLGFWSRLAQASRDEKKPILCLAPMADVTDSAFRYVIAKCSKENSRESFNNYVTWTEFVSADGLVLAHEEGKRKLLKDLEYSEIERPIVAQLFGSRPENMKKAAYLVASLGFDGLDINMGCPDKSIEKQGAGAAMIKNPQLAREVIRAAKEGVEEYAKEKGKEVIPVSVKTRLGYNKDELDTWIPELLAEEPAVITIHARTRKEMSKVPARWERIKRAVEIRDAVQKSKVLSEDTDISLLRNSLQCSPQSGSQAPLQQLCCSDSSYSDKAKTLIFGNGDVLDLAHSEKLAKETGADGVMLGRAIFGNPFLFRKFKREQKGPELVEGQYTPTQKEQLEALLAHIQLFDQNLGKVKSFAVMKKHFKSYLSFLVPFAQNNDLENELKDLKDALLNSTTAEEAIALIDAFIPKIKA